MEDLFILDEHEDGLCDIEMVEGEGIAILLFVNLPKKYAEPLYARIVAAFNLYLKNGGYKK